MRKKTIKFGIMPHEQFVNYTMAIARGEYKPKKGEPKVWFESLKSLAQILSNENQDLLRIIMEQKPKSIKELAEATGRKSNNVSRTLKTMERYNIVDLVKEDRKIQPVLMATDFKLQFGLNGSFGHLFLKDDKEFNNIARPAKR